MKAQTTLRAEIDALRARIIAGKQSHGQMYRDCLELEAKRIQIGDPAVVLS